LLIQARLEVWYFQHNWLQISIALIEALTRQLKLVTGKFKPTKTLGFQCAREKLLQLLTWDIVDRVIVPGITQHGASAVKLGRVVS
jgi:hypothetical protein